MESGAKFSYMTNGQVPEPMIRVPQDDTVTLTWDSPRHSGKVPMAKDETAGKAKLDIFRRHVAAEA
jgi:hypothetical protein